MPLAIATGLTAGLATFAMVHAASGDRAEAHLGTIATLAAIAGLSATMAGLALASGQRILAALLSVLAFAPAIAWTSAAAPRGAGREELLLLPNDRMGLEEVTIEGARWVRHRTLGFRFPQPEARLLPARDLADETAERASEDWLDRHQVWAFATPERELTVTFDLARSASRTPAGAAAEVAALLESATEGLEADGHRVEVREPSVIGSCVKAGFTAQLERGGVAEGAIIRFEERATRRAFHLVVTIVGPASAGAREYLDSIEVPCGA